jgi:hypothetical protein
MSLKRLERNMVSQEAIFTLIYNAATCFIPTKELTSEQLEKLDNITIRGCTCRLCRGKHLGHANSKRLEIGWSKPFFSELVTQKLSMNATLFEAVGTVLHEIIHILFPQYDEEETRKQTCEWLKKNLWFEYYRQMQCLSRSELIDLGYSLKEHEQDQAH